MQTLGPQVSPPGKRCVIDLAPQEPHSLFDHHRVCLKLWSMFHCENHGDTLIRRKDKIVPSRAPACVLMPAHLERSMCQSLDSCEREPSTHSRNEHNCLCLSARACSPACSIRIRTEHILCGRSTKWKTKNKKERS